MNKRNFIVKRLVTLMYDNGTSTLIDMDDNFDIVACGCASSLFEELESQLYGSDN